MKILTFTSLFPNPVLPGHGIFVETRLRHLMALEGVEARVIAPVPALLGKSAAVVEREEKNGLTVLHPPYRHIPGLGLYLAPSALAAAGLKAARQLLADGYDFELIDAHYLYPDGVAAARIAKKLNKPFVLTARGSDVNLLPNYRFARKRIIGACRQADALITVSEALKKKLIGIGVGPGKITVLRNGVDLEKFKPVDRAEARAEWGVTGQVIVSVGNLVELKGHDLTIRALMKLPDATLLIAGQGPLKEDLTALAQSLGLSDRVRFLGRVSQERLAGLYSAADALVLASSREGWANVLLEALACATPVVATDAGGNGEVLADSIAGILVERNPEAIAEGLQSLFAAQRDRTIIRKYAEKFDWAPTSHGQLEIFKRIASR